MKQNRIHLALFFVLVFLLALPFVSYAKEPKRGAYFEYATLETLTSQTLGSEGGSIVFDQKNSPLYGVTLTFPAGGASLKNACHHIPSKGPSQPAGRKASHSPRV